MVFPEQIGFFHDLNHQPVCSVYFPTLFHQSFGLREHNYGYRVIVPHTAGAGVSA